MERKLLEELKNMAAKNNVTYGKKKVGFEELIVCDVDYVTACKDHAIERMPTSNQNLCSKDQGKN